MSEKNEKRYEKEKQSTSVWLYLHLLLVFGLSLFVLYGSKEVSLYYLIGMWVIMIVYAWRTLVYIGIRRFLPCVVFALVIVYCILSLTFKVAQGEEERDINAEEAEYEIGTEEAESESGAEEAGAKSESSAEEASESASSIKGSSDDHWHYDFKNEEDISCSRKGCFSLYTYSFRGEGKKHTKEEIEKYHIQKNMLGVCYPSVKSECKIEWPEEESGLTPAALAKVRRAILWMAFPQTEPFSCLPYERLKGFGETPGSILKYLGMIDTNKWEYLDHYISDSIEDGYLSNSGNFSLSAFVLSSYMGKLPATEGDEVGDDCLRFSLDFAKQFANECYECKLENYHQCSQYTFDAAVELSWPFGLKAKDGAKWYERPILCVNYSGYANDGGHGNHSMTMSKIYSLPDGEEQIFKDYFDSDKLDDLKAFVKQRVIRDWLENSEEGIKEMEAFGFYLDNILVSEEGMMFKWPPYAILPGSGGSPEVLIEWKDLEEFKK